MTHVRKPPVSDRANEWGRWTVAWFRTQDARDEFVRSVAETPDGGWNAEASPDDGLGAQVRWLPGRFLRLNDIAYAHGGRIVVVVDPHGV
jgi:hypothetical protein